MFKKILTSALIAMSLVTGGAATAASATPAPNTITVYGDSNSTGHHVDLWNGYNGGFAYSASMDDFTLVDGWAHDGGTSVGVRNHAAPTAASIQLIMIGTNDIDQGIDRDVSFHNIWLNIQEVNADNVVLLAIPPFTQHKDEAAAYNRRLKATAESHGWLYFDGWWATGQKITTSAWAPGANANNDGKHPVQAGYDAFGVAVNEFLLENFGTGTVTTTPATVQTPEDKTKTTQPIDNN